MRTSALEMGSDRTDDLVGQINEVIDKRIRPRLSPFSIDIELLDVFEDNTLKIRVNRRLGSVFDISQEILERIIASTLEAFRPEIKGIIFIR